LIKIRNRSGSIYAGARGMTHHPSPSMNAPSTSAKLRRRQRTTRIQNPLGSVIELPAFLLRASSTSGTAAAADTNSPSAAAVFSSAPGMALTQEQNSEPLFMPSFLRRARSAHDAIEPQSIDGVIPIARANNVATGAHEC